MTTPRANDEYLLGHDEAEQRRLRGQDEVWAAETESFMDRLGLSEGKRVLEIGCGIGLGLPRLGRRVGVGGRVVGFERNHEYLAASRRLIRDQGLEQAEIFSGDIERDVLPEGPFDAIYSRWVFSYLPDVEAVLRRLRPLLATGGRIGLLDYNHDGIRVFPEAPRFDEVIAAVRRWFAIDGGNCWVAGVLPLNFVNSGYRVLGVHPFVPAGPPDSPVYRWVEDFLFVQAPHMIGAGVLSEAQWAAFVEEWERMRGAAGTILYSPMQVGVLAQAR